jgi:glycosyltransferase involved in cell wall biosynthesis
VALFARINKKPLVMTYHMDAKDPGWKKILYWPYQKIWLRLFLRAPQKIICSSYDYIVHSEAAGYFQKHREKFIEIPFGVDTQEFKPGKPTEEFYKKYNLSTQTKYILMVGGLDSAHYFKGVHVLLEAFAKWNKREKENWELIIVGDGDLKKTYQYKAEVLGINKVVHFPGRVAQQNLPDMYRNASIFTLPSLDSSEAFGIVLLEALACGTPSVATNLPGVRQVISSIDGGMIAKPNSANGLCKAWNEVVEKKDKDQNWSNNIASKVEQIFSRKKEIYSLAEVFRSELKSKNE